MVKVTLSISSKDTMNKTVTDKIHYVNPEATNTELVEFAEMLKALSADTYTSTTKITEEVID